MEPIDNFVEEVKEELRKDQVLAFWKQYGNTIIALGIALVVGTAGTLAYNSYRTSKVEENAKQFEQALEAIDAKDGKKTQEILQELKSDGYVFLSPLQKEAQATSTDEREAILKTLSQNKDLPELYRQLATYRYFQFALENTESGAFLKEIQTHLKDRSPVMAGLKELQGLALMKQKSVKEAIAVFGELVKDENTPQGIRVRARAMIELLSR